MNPKMVAAAPQKELVSADMQSDVNEYQGLRPKKTIENTITASKEKI